MPCDSLVAHRMLPQIWLSWQSLQSEMSAKSERSRTTGLLSLQNYSKSGALL